MKRLFILFLSVGVLVSCNNKKAGEKTGDMKTTDTEKKDEKTDMTTDDKDKSSETVTGWPEKDKKDFMDNCVENAFKNTNDQAKSQSYCSCMLEKMQQEYPDVNRAGSLSDSEIQAVIDKYKDGCLAQ